MIRPLGKVKLGSCYRLKGQKQITRRCQGNTCFKLRSVEPRPYPKEECSKFGRWLHQSFSHRAEWPSHGASLTGTPFHGQPPQANIAHIFAFRFPPDYKNCTFWLMRLKLCIEAHIIRPCTPRNNELRFTMLTFCIIRLAQLWWPKNSY